MNNQFLENRKMKLPIGLLNVDMYQKKIRKNIVKKIVNNFNPAALGVIHVSQRQDGTFWIFDGQHRVEAMKQMGYEAADCLVFSGMTYQQESQALVSHHDVSKPSKVEEHFAKMEAQDVTALTINNTLESIGLRIMQGSGSDSIQAVGTLYTIYEKNGLNDLVLVLKTLKEAFGRKTEVFLRHNMLGMQSFIEQYRGIYDEKWLIKRLKTKDITDLTSKADVYKRVNGFNKTEAIKMVITEFYNHKKSKHLKLK